MNREEFFDRLKKGIAALNEDERNEALADYNEHFDAALSEGSTEEEIAKKLGPPETLAKEYVAEASFIKAKKHSTVKNTTKAVFAEASFGFLGVVLAVPLYIAGIVTAAALFIVSVALIIACIVGVVIVAGGFTLPWDIVNVILAMFDPVAVSFALAGVTFLGLALFQLTRILLGWFLRFMVWLTGRTLGRRKSRNEK